MKANIHKSTTNLTMNESDSNAHVVMLVVYGMLFGAWLFVQLSA